MPLQIGMPGSLSTYKRCSYEKVIIRLCCHFCMILAFDNEHICRRYWLGLFGRTSRRKVDYTWLLWQIPKRGVESVIKFHSTQLKMWSRFKQFSQTVPGRRTSLGWPKPRRRGEQLCPGTPEPHQASRWWLGWKLLQKQLGILLFVTQHEPSLPAQPFLTGPSGIPALLTLLAPNFQQPPLAGKHSFYTCVHSRPIHGWHSGPDSFLIRTEYRMTLYVTAPFSGLISEFGWWGPLCHIKSTGG